MVTNTETFHETCLFYDHYGDVISLDDWCKLRSDSIYCMIGKTQVYDYVVSTVWMGIDYSYCPGPPIIFETMVFDKDGNGIEQIRYSNIFTAQAGHGAMIKEYSLQRAE